MNEISIIGLGYVGLPLAVAFAENGFNVIGFDLNKSKILKYKDNYDVTNEVGNDKLHNIHNITFTYDEHDLQNSKFHIVAVPTPISFDKTPDLNPVAEATKIVGRNLIPGSIVVFESTVYPGVTEEICIPILEKESGLEFGKDFRVGYSPERINPGDHVHKLENIIKIVSGSDETALEEIARNYGKIIKAGIYRAPSIKVAEAAKVIENTQRDANIALMNELSLIFDKMGIDTKEVLTAAGTKWNFLKFEPGLVGGHCIGVDPYYLTYKAQQFGYRPEVILASRTINDNMGMFIGEKIIKKMVINSYLVNCSKVLFLGITFKENVADIRNSKVFDIINCLIGYGVSPIIHDPVADSEEVLNHYGIVLTDIDMIHDVDVIVVSVAHNCYKEFTMDFIKSLYKKNISKPLIFDIKGLYNKNLFEESFDYWRL